MQGLRARLLRNRVTREQETLHESCPWPMELPYCLLVPWVKGQGCTRTLLENRFQINLESNFLAMSGKEENSGYRNFLFFKQCFLKPSLIGPFYYVIMKQRGKNSYAVYYLKQICCPW